MDDRPRHLVIRTERDEDGRVRLSVRDTGVGFEPGARTALRGVLHDQERRDGDRAVRQPLHRREPPRPPVGRPNDGPGATFIFSLPCGVREARTPLSWTARPGRGAPGRRRGLIAPRSLVSVVDDDESVRESLPDLLRELGFRVEAFSSAEAFLASAASADAVPGPGRGHAGDVGTRPAGSWRAAAGGPHRLHHRPPRRRRPSPHAGIGGAVECLFKPFSEETLVGRDPARARREVRSDAAHDPHGFRRDDDVSMRERSKS